MSLKKIVLVVLIVGFMSLMFWNLGSSVSSYTNLDNATDGIEVHVVGTFDKTAEYGYNDDKTHFYFHFKDLDNQRIKVIYPQPMPPNLQLAERIVVIGKRSHNNFYANRILLKCPSKYNTTEDIGT